MSKYGIAFSGTDDLARASGTSHNAAERSYKNFFDLATQGSTAESLKIADVGPGCVVDAIRIETDANLSGQTFTIGTIADPVKYGAAVAGPNATSVVRYPPLARKLDATTDREEVFLFPNGAIAAAGSIRTTLFASHR
jgi:hypothetical protein